MLRLQTLKRLAQGAWRMGLAMLLSGVLGVAQPGLAQTVVVQEAPQLLAAAWPKPAVAPTTTLPPQCKSEEVSLPDPEYPAWWIWVFRGDAQNGSKLTSCLVFYLRKSNGEVRISHKLLECEKIGMVTVGEGRVQFAAGGKLHCPVDLMAEAEKASKYNPDRDTEKHPDYVLLQPTMPYIAFHIFARAQVHSGSGSSATTSLLRYGSSQQATSPIDLSFEDNGTTFVPRFASKQLPEWPRIGVPLAAGLQRFDAHFGLFHYYWNSAAAPEAALADPCGSSICSIYVQQVAGLDWNGNEFRRTYGTWCGGGQWLCKFSSLAPTSMVNAAECKSIEICEDNTWCAGSEACKAGFLNSTVPFSTTKGGYFEMGGGELPLDVAWLVLDPRATRGGGGDGGWAKAQLLAENVCKFQAGGTTFDCDFRSPANASQTGNPGQTVMHTITLTNVSGLTDSYTVTRLGHSFTTTAPASVGPLVPGASTTLNVAVTIPSNAVVGTYDVVRVRLQSQNNPTFQVDTHLMTQVQAETNFVGVIPDTNNCGGYELITIYMDDENTNNNNAWGGWLGYITSNSNTTLRFCRVPASLFKPLALTHTQLNAHYAVLRLGATCPTGSVPFERHFDNQDGSSGNWSQGNIWPNVSTRSPSFTRLHFCLFRGGSTIMTEFPPLGFNYGVFAAGGFIKAFQSGWFYTDDENNNANGYVADAGWAIDAKRIVSDGSNTTVAVAKVVNDPPPPQPTSLSAGGFTQGISLNWTSQPAIDYYAVMRAGGGIMDFFQIGQTASFSYIDNDPALQTGTTYCYYVQGFRNGTVVTTSNNACAMRTTAPPPCRLETEICLEE